METGPWKADAEGIKREILEGYREIDAGLAHVGPAALRKFLVRYMIDTDWLAQQLHDALPPLLGERATHAHVSTVVAVARRLATAALQSRRTLDTLMYYHALTPDDLAIDCIADLFQQNEILRYVELERYFAGIPIASMEPTELLVCFRRLISGKVNNAVFRLYNEVDPGLGRIIRNIKLAIHSLRSFDEVDRFGEPCIVPALCDRLLHLPPPTKEQVSEGIAEALTGPDRVPDMLAALSVYLRSQTSHARVVPLLQVALAIRDVVVRRNTAYEIASEAIEPDSGFLPAEAIERASLAVERQYRDFYLGKRNVTADVWKAYFTVIEDYLRHKFESHEEMPTSLFEGIRRTIPGLTRSAYIQSHRARLEHLHRLVERRLIDHLKKGPR